MSIAGEIQYKVVVDTKSLKSGLDTAEKETKSFADKAGNAMVGIAKTAGKVALAAVATSTAAIAGLTKKAVESYSDFEQLSGGVETLFKDSANTVMQNAQEAYRTAGISANEYMEQATSFSASLIRSLGGDTKKAAELTDMAIKDMADNANKMGTDIQSIQNAYAGLAKGNATMLDNLKVGYGGTQTEMLQLAKDMGVVDASVQSFNEIGFDKSIEAIHKVQEQLGITGTTAEEASSTIEGSLNQTKAAWADLIGTLGHGGDDGTALWNFENSLKQMLDNLVPVIKRAIAGIVDLLSFLVPDLIAMIPELINDLLPAVISGAQTLLMALIQALPTVLDVLLQAIPQLINAIIVITQSLLQALPTILNVVIQIILAIVKELTKPESLAMLLSAGLQLFLALVKAIPDIIIALTNALPDIINNIIDFLTDPDTIKALIEASVILFMALVQAVPQILGALFSAFGKLFANLWEKLKGIFTAFTAKFGEAISGIFKGAINAVLGFIEGALNAPIKAINGFIGIINKIPGVSIGQLSLLQLPRLATGGIVPSTNGGQLILAGEGGQDEWVIPESKMADMVEKLNERTNGTGGGVTINIQGVFATSESEQRRVAEQIYQKLNEINKSRMGAFI